MAGGDNSGVTDLYAEWAGEETARREQQERLKDLFGRFKGNTKALRSAFRQHYASEHEDPKQRQKREENDADTELFLSALARVREAEAEKPKKSGAHKPKPDPKEITHSASLHNPEDAADGGGSDLNQEPSPLIHGSDLEAHEVVEPELVPHQPEGDSSETARPDPEPVKLGGRHRHDPDTREDSHHDVEAIDRQAHQTGEPALSNAPDTITMTDKTGGAVEPSPAPSIPDGGYIGRAAAAEADTRTDIQRVYDETEAKREAAKLKPLRDHCLRPGPNCAGQGRNHCFECEKAHADAEGLAA